MLKIIFILMILILNSAVANDKVISYQKEHNFSTAYRFSAAQLTSQTENDDEVIYSFDINTRYAFAEYVGLNLSLGRWFSNESQENNYYGDLANQTSLGLTFGLSPLIKREKVSIYHKNEFKNNKLMSKRIKKTKIENNDGFRINLNVSSMEFSRLTTPVTTYGGEIYYEYSFSRTTSLQLGVKHDYVNDNNVNLNLTQLLIGINITP